MQLSKINIDMNSSSVLACGQVAFNPRVLRRNRKDQFNFALISEHAVFLRPQSKGTVGCGGNTTPACRKYPRRTLARLKTPGTLQVAKLQKLRRTTMSTPQIAPEERLSAAQHKLDFLATLLNIAIGDGEDCNINFCHPSNLNGLFYSLTGIADEIGLALDDLSKMEVKP